MADAASDRIPVLEVPRNRIGADKQRQVAKYGERYEMSRAEMAALVDSDAIVADTAVIKWRHGYHRFNLLLAARRCDHKSRNNHRNAPVVIVG